MQNQKSRPRRTLCQGTVSGRDNPKSLGKGLTLNHRQPPIALSVTGKRHGHKEPKRESKHGENKINERLYTCAWIRNLGDTVPRYQVISSRLNSNRLQTAASSRSLD